MEKLGAQEAHHTAVPTERGLDVQQCFEKQLSLGRPLQLSEQGQILEAAIEAAANAVIKIVDSLNEWDSRTGDGDCGSTMYKGAPAILEDLETYPLNDTAETVNEIGSSIGRVMGGKSRIIYSIFCKAFYAQLKTSTRSDVTAKKCEMIEYCNRDEALEAAIATVSKYGGASAGYRTLLDALIPASTVLQEKLNAGEDSVTTFLLSSEAALAGAESTIHMQAQAGRSTYVPVEILASVPDPGAMDAVSWYRAAALAVRDKCQPS
ncbi:putative 3,4-dihydroxy-2-butanone kinase [Humulus lupulus]|uniref:putative 3,4-dihydroxy-2-butanone kinase n=1 Tax=Humulus lupulus TaxID=3486 RepID=UPI002B40534A|nr:putative 3,4-dihydroxy-2-butanone kinase [Humulus lupulus]